MFKPAHYWSMHCTHIVLNSKFTTLLSVSSTLTPMGGCCCPSNRQPFPHWRSHRASKLIGRILLQELCSFLSGCSNCQEGNGVGSQTVREAEGQSQTGAQLGEPAGSRSMMQRSWRRSRAVACTSVRFCLCEKQYFETFFYVTILQ